MLILDSATHTLGITSVVKNHKIANMAKMNCYLHTNKHAPDQSKPLRKIQAVDYQQKARDQEQE